MNKYSGLHVVMGTPTQCGHTIENRSDSQYSYGWGTLEKNYTFRQSLLETVSTSSAIHSQYCRTTEIIERRSNPVYFLTSAHLAAIAA